MRLRSVLIASGAIGWLLGIAHVDWQWALEHAQVLAGIVRYAPEDPMAAQSGAAWSLVSQVAAIGLRLGVTEATLSWFLSGLLGLVSCQAVAVTIFALSGRGVASLGMLFVIIMSRAVDWGLTYPIWLYGTAHTYGAIGLSTAALAIARAGAGAARSSAFVAPVAVAVHPSLGAFALLILIVVWVWAGRSRREVRLAPAFGSGLLILIASFAVSRVLAPDAVTVAEDTRPYLLSLLKYWDGHRLPIAWSEGAVRLVAGLVFICAMWLSRGATTSGSTRVHLLRAGVVTGVLSLAAIAATHLPVDTQPAWLVAIMPGRLANVALVFAVPVLLGLALTLPGRWGAVLTALIILGLIASKRSLLWSWLFGVAEDARRPGLDQMTVLGVAVAALVVAMHRTTQRSATAAPGRDRLAAAFRAATSVIVVAAIVLVALDARREWIARRDLLNDWRTDPVFAAAHGAGTVITSGDPWLVQLRTRAPVLIDPGAIDVLLYAPAAAPAADRILQRVYGVSLLNPPAGLKPEGRLPLDQIRAVWERYSRQDWVRVGQELRATRVITQGGWQLNLPSLMFGRGIQVFAIPDR